MTNKNSLGLIADQLDEYTRDLAEAGALAAALITATKTHRLNQGNLTTAQRVAYRQALRKLMTRHEAARENLIVILEQADLLTADG
jgi:hypothetical protein